MRTLSPQLLGFAGFSGAGKTTLLTSIIPLLNQQGIKAGVIKTSHHSIEVDQPGKDSYRLRMAGASPTMLVSPARRVIISELSAAADLSLASQLTFFPTQDVDLILVEGYRDADIAKIEIHRPALGKPLLYPDDKHIIAVACDTQLSIPAPLWLLDLNNPPAICEFILQQVLDFQ